MRAFKRYEGRIFRSGAGGLGCCCLQLTVVFSGVNGNIECNPVTGITFDNLVINGSYTLLGGTPTWGLQAGSIDETHHAGSDCSQPPTGTFTVPLNIEVDESPPGTYHVTVLPNGSGLADIVFDGTGAIGVPIANTTASPDPTKPAYGGTATLAFV